MGAVGLSAPVSPHGASAGRAPAPRAAGTAIDAHRDALLAPAFAALALLAGMRFASLLSSPPLLRVLAISLCATLCGVALGASRRVHARRAVARALRVGAVALAGYGALRAAGAPAHMLWPWRWADLANELNAGVGQLDGLWPYRGARGDVRLAIMLVPPLVILLAAALVFWPGARGASRRAVGLALLLALYAVGAANEPRAGWRVQGVLLLCLLALWAWCSREREDADAGRAAAWLVPGAVLALAVAGTLSREHPLVDYQHWNPFGAPAPLTRFEWNQTYGPLRWPGTNETMVEVSAATPRLWRATTLDRFDGVRFLRSGAPPTGTSGVPVPTPVRWITRTTFTVRGFGAPQLLTPGAALEVSVSGPSIPRLEAIAPDGSVTAAGPPAASGDRYTVTAYAPQPSARELRAAPPRVPAAYLPFTEFGVPSAGAHTRQVSATDAAGIATVQASPYAPVYSLARRLAASTSGEYATAVAIEGYLARGFIYDERPHAHRYPLVSFLLHERRGYCQQFSGAMALMLRMDGIPARVGSGFLPGERDAATGGLRVSARDAHAWVEVFFSGIGWVSFDPTPPKPSRLAIPLGGGFARAGSTGNASAPGAGAATLSTPAAGTATTDRGSSGGEALVAALAALAGVLLAGLLWLRVAPGPSRRRRARAETRRDAVAQLCAALAPLGVAPAPGTTLLELETRLSSSHGAHAARYVELLRGRRYRPGLTPAPTRADRRAARNALAAHHGPLTRARLLLALPPWSRAM